MNINELFESFNRLRVLIIGDVMVDSYIFGKVERISPEAPVPVVNYRHKESRLGGAANVVQNVKALGATPIICSVVGDDKDADELTHLFAEHHVSTEGIIRSKERITTVKQRIMAGSQQVCRVDFEMDSPISADDQKHLLEKVKTLGKDCDVIIFEDYDKGVLSKETIAEIVAFAKSSNIPTIVDPKKRNFNHYIGVDLFKPNLKELKEGLKIEINAKNQTELEAKIEEAKGLLGVNGILLTLSELGVYIDYKNERRHVSAHIRQIADVSGAGDTVVSAAACCLALGCPPNIIAEISNLAGGLVCEYVGAVPINKEQLRLEALNILQ